ncbi:nitrilase, partial [candidate division KSB1 bacterium]|nr:nitrilase [candidate division KSB1 bacterium]
MNNLQIATAQFENRSADKAYNLGIIETLSCQAALAGADVIAFHECSVTGYTFARNLSREQMLAISEYIPAGDSVKRLIHIAQKADITILAGLFEKTQQDEIYKAYLCVDKNGLKAKYRKLHPFINKYVKQGNEYVVFDINGWKCGILI